MSTTIGAPAQSSQPNDTLAPARQQRDFQDGEVSRHARSVDRLSDKAMTASAEVATDPGKRQPSAVYVRAYESREASYTYSTTGPNAVSKPSSSDIAAGNILNFISNQLARDAADGASQEELASRIEAGLSGFLKGFEQARGEIDDAGLLSEGIASDIQQTYDKVLAGVDKLKSEYLGEQGSSQAIGDASAPSSRPLAEQSRSSSEAYFASNSVAQSNSLNFTVTTLDGDRITINSSGLQAMVQEGLKYSGSGGSGAYFASSQYQENNFELIIEGQLDKGEMSALTDLLSQVNDLAETFFNGDIESAFNEALSLGYDSSEISDFALNLSQTTVSRSATAYQNVAESGGGLSERLKPLGSMVRGLMDATESARSFQYPQQLITSIAEQIEAARNQSNRFQPFLEQLMATLPSLAEAR